MGDLIKDLEFLSEAGKKHISQKHVNDAIYYLVIEQLKKKRIKADLLTDIKDFMRDTDVFWIPELDEVATVIKNHLDTDSLSYDDAYSTIEHAVVQMSEHINDYYHNRMNFAPGEWVKPPTSLIVQAPNDAEIKEALKKFLRVNLEEAALGSAAHARLAAIARDNAKTVSTLLRRVMYSTLPIQAVKDIKRAVANLHLQMSKVLSKDDLERIARFAKVDFEELKDILNVELTESDVFKQWAQENKAKKEKARREEKERQRQEKAAKAASRKKSKVSDQVILNKVENAISNSFPDGDPIDHISHFLDRNNLTMDDVNRAFRKLTGRSYDRTMIDSWAQYAADAAHDANNMIAKGKKPVDSPFYTWKEGDKKVKLTPNPWKAS